MDDTEHVDNSNPEMRETVARLAEALPARMEQIAANAVTLGTRLSVEVAGGDPEQVAQIVAEVTAEHER
jgi:hypothetical protein